MSLLRRVSNEQSVHGRYDEDVARFLQSVPPNAIHAVLKCHTLDPVGRALVQSGAARVVFTQRDVADAVASFMNMFGVDFYNAFGAIASSLELYRFYRQQGDSSIIDYQEIMAASSDAIRRIAAYLGIDPGPYSIGLIAEETSLHRTKEKVAQLETIKDGLVQAGNGAYDPESLLHVRHIRDGNSGYGRKLLTADQINQIAALERQFGPDS